MKSLEDRLRPVLEQFFAEEHADILAWTFSGSWTGFSSKGRIVGPVPSYGIGGNQEKNSEVKSGQAKKRVILTDKKLKGIEKEIRHRRMMAGPPQPVVAPRPNQFMYRERERE